MVERKFEEPDARIYPGIRRRWRPVADHFERSEIGEEGPCHPTGGASDDWGVDHRGTEHGADLHNLYKIYSLIGKRTAVLEDGSER